MLKTSALRYFKTHQACAEVAGCTRAAVSMWPRVVPLERAIAIELYTGGKVPVIRSMYPHLVNAERLAKERVKTKAAA